jgi:methyl-accepting chemotaxis protein
MTIKTKLMILGFLSITLILSIGLVGYWGMNRVSNGMADIVTTSSVLRNHMLEDMMHDAVNSDVQGALLVGQGGTTDLATIEADFKEHSTIFLDTLKENQALVTSGPIHDALEKTKPKLEAYIASAESIIKLSNGNRDGALAKLTEFKTTFDALADEMEALSQLIEGETVTMQKNGESAVSSAETILLVFCLIGIGVIATISWLIGSNIIESLSRLIGVSNKVANGDLTVQIDTSGSDEIGSLAASMETMRNRLKQLVTQITNTTNELATASGQIASITTQTSQRVKNQQSETEQVATAMNEMTSTVHEVASNITLTASSANKAHAETKTGSHVMTQAVQQIQVLVNQIGDASEIINKLEKNSHNISSVLDVIKSIAEQTNLLALNAAIEAARAGEQGRGFAVVADEVRTLASRTQKSTEEINQMIEELQSGSKASVDAMERSRSQADLAVSQAMLAGDSLSAISTAVTQITDMSAQIASAAEEQGSVSEEINRNIVRINTMTNETADSTQQTASATHELARMTSELQQMIRQFKV